MLAAAAGAHKKPFIQITFYIKMASSSFSRSSSFAFFCRLFVEFELPHLSATYAIFCTIQPELLSEGFLSCPIFFHQASLRNYLSLTGSRRSAYARNCI